MRINAYVLAGDPNFLAASVLSYYDHVDRIVVSYDRNATSWTGTVLPVDECLGILKELDREGRCELAPGDFWRPGENPLESETIQRRAALAQASDGADWVLQLDTDEVVADPAAFLGALEHADAAGADALDYPSRWLYARTGPAGRGAGLYLESSTRLWGPVAGYPGPLAVRAGTHLDLARQAHGAPLYRVDVRPQNTDPAHPRDAAVHEVVRTRSAVLHYSWVRSDDYMRRKLGWSGHAAEYSDPAIYQAWAWRSRHPLLTGLATPLRRRGERYRVVRLPEPEGYGPAD
ncbi:MAG: hypothetical protein FWF90_14335 [Promicromonosporaceae bacterium]|nr:hypothetical protein [Promicromonosporaceae bacterium]